MKKITKFIDQHWKVILGLLLVVHIIVKIYQLGTIPISLYWDETAMLTDAKVIADTGKDMHSNSWLQAMFPSYGDYKLPVYIWLTSILVKIFGVTAVSLRGVSVVVSMMQVVVLLWFGSEVAKQQGLHRTESRVLLLCITFISLITPWMFHFSRVGFEGFLGQFFVTVSVLAMFLTNRKPWMWILVAITGAMGVYSYYSVRFVWPILVITFAALRLQLWSKRNFTHEFKKVFLQPIIAIIAWGICLLPLFTTPFYQPSQMFRLSTPSILNSDLFIHQSNQLRAEAGNGPLSRVIYHRNVLRSRAVLENFAKHLHPNFLFFRGDPNLRHGSGSSGVLLLSMAPCLIFGVFVLWEKNRRFLVLLIIWWLIGLLPASVPLDSPHALRSLNSLTPLVLLCSFGFFHIIRQITLNKFQNWKWWLNCSLLLAIILNSLLFFHDYFAHYSDRSATEWQPGYQELSKFIHLHKDEVRTIWANTGDDRFYLWILAFSPVKGEEIHQLSFQNYQLKEMENVKFESFNWESLDTLDHKILVIEKPGQLLIEPDQLTFIKSSDGVTRFEIGLYGQ